jgi:hypothetical protein
MEKFNLLNQKSVRSEPERVQKFWKTWKIIGTSIYYGKVLEEI